MADGQHAPPGWYPDPANIRRLAFAVRYWDGEVWADEVRWWDGLGWRRGDSRYTAILSWVFCRRPFWFRSLSPAVGTVFGAFVGNILFWLAHVLTGGRTYFHPLYYMLGTLLGALLVAPFLIRAATRRRRDYGEWAMRPPAWGPPNPA